MYNVDQNKSHAGEMAYYAGLSAEDAAARRYCAMGYRLLAQRWRGTAGEIDLIFSVTDTFVFVEVKKAARFDAAAHRISWRQQQRIFDTASEFVGTKPRGQLSDMRFDVALVDRTGAVEVIENALSGA